MKSDPEKHYSNKITFSQKYAQECKTEFRTDHWYKSRLNIVLEISHGAASISLHAVTAEDLRALATMLADTADQIDEHQAQLDAVTA